MLLLYLTYEELTHNVTMNGITAAYNKLYLTYEELTLNDCSHYNWVIVMLYLTYEELTHNFDVVF